MILKNQLADKYETIASSLKEQNKQQIDEIQIYNDAKMKQVLGQLEEFQQENL